MPPDAAAQHQADPQGFPDLPSGCGWRCDIEPGTTAEWLYSGEGNPLKAIPIICFAFLCTLWHLVDPFSGFRESVGEDPLEATQVSTFGSFIYHIMIPRHANGRLVPPRSPMRAGPDEKLEMTASRRRLACCLIPSKWW